MTPVTTSYVTPYFLPFLKLHLSILTPRGNGSEIIALAEAAGKLLSVKRRANVSLLSTLH